MAPCHTWILLSPLITRINLETCIIFKSESDNRHKAQIPAEAVENDQARGAESIL